MSWGLSSLLFLSFSWGSSRASASYLFCMFLMAMRLSSMSTLSV